MKRKIFLSMLFLMVILTSATAASAQDRIPTDDEVNAIAKNLYCPVCPNTPLDVCETKACEDWRAQIRDQLSEGWNEQQIVEYFVAQYGERVLAEPQRKGFTSLVWMLPVMAVLFGIVLVWQVLKNWRLPRQSTTRGNQNPAIAAETLARIEKELREME